MDAGDSSGTSVPFWGICVFFGEWRSTFGAWEVHERGRKQLRGGADTRFFPVYQFQLYGKWGYFCINGLIWTIRLLKYVCVFPFAHNIIWHVTYAVALQSYIPASFPPDGGHPVPTRLQQTGFCWDHPCGGVPNIIVTSIEVRELQALCF